MCDVTGAMHKKPIGQNGLFPDSAQAKGELTAELRGHTETVNDLVFSLDNSHLYSCGSDMKIIEWNADAGQLSRCACGRETRPGSNGPGAVEVDCIGCSLTSTGR
jgi:WD40 repeat protein